jgi:hypothetical protein
VPAIWFGPYCRRPAWEGPSCVWLRGPRGFWQSRGHFRTAMTMPALAPAAKAPYWSAVRRPCPSSPPRCLRGGPSKTGRLATSAGRPGSRVIPAARSRCFKPRFPRGRLPGASAASPSTEVTSSEERWQRFPPQSTAAILEDAWEAAYQVTGVAWSGGAQPQPGHRRPRSY